MIDNREDILAYLKGFTQYTYHNNVPNFKDSNYPKTSYFLKNNYDDDFRDGVAYANVGEYVVQVFEKVINGKLIEIHKNILKKFKSEGYAQIGFDYFFDEEDKVHIYTFRFRKKNLYEEGEL